MISFIIILLVLLCLFVTTVYTYLNFYEPEDIELEIMKIYLFIYLIIFLIVLFI